MTFALYIITLFIAFCFGVIGMNVIHYFYRGEERVAINLLAIFAIFLFFLCATNNAFNQIAEIQTFLKPFEMKGV